MGDERHRDERDPITGASASGINPRDLTVYNGEVLFSGVDTGGSVGLWAWNGTSAVEITGIGGTFATGLHPQDMTVYNGEALFNGFDAGGQAGLWVTNGTAAGTQELTGINGADIGPSGFTLYNGELLFNGKDTNGHDQFVGDERHRRGNTRADWRHRGVIHLI